MKRPLQILFAFSIIVSLLLASCTPRSSATAASKLARVTNPDATPAELTELVSGNNAFAFDLYQAMHTADGNLIYSPYSISLAFAMPYAGARAATASQMAEVLHYTLADGKLHPAFNALDLDLARRPDQAANVNDKDRFQLSIANSLWGQDGWSFRPEYLDLLAINYGAGMRLVDFAKAPESARKQINDWVSDQTKKRIENIIPPGVLDQSTRLVLANAIYFKATWQREFDANDTADKPFHLLDGTTVLTPMMTFGHSVQLSYAAGEGWQAVALPYKGGLTEMVIIVPDSGNFAAFESTLTARRYNEIVAAFQPQSVELSMPKFKFESEYGLKDLLTGMGMTNAFDPDTADFSGIDDLHPLYIDNALHKAFIAVDEKGTEAAAATVILMAPASMPLEGIKLTIDRPFIYVIRDVPTETILFMGRVLNPAD
jgi:serpin B